jgi:hypothetical protein
MYGPRERRPWMFDVERSIAEASGVFNALVEYLRGEAQAHRAYRVESRVFRDLLAMGLPLMRMWFEVKAGGDVGPSLTTEAEQVLRREALKGRRLITVFGELAVLRWYYHRNGAAGVFPLDEIADLPESTYSYFVQDLLGQAVAGRTYDDALADFEKLFGFRPPKHTLEDMMPAIAADADPYYEALGIPSAETEADLLVAAVDGKGVPMVKQGPAERRVRLRKGEKLSRKKEAVVAAVYTIAPHVRTPEEIVAEVRDKEPPRQRPKPQNKRLRATLGGKEDAFAAVAAEVERRDPLGEKRRVCLMDGSRALWVLALATLKGFTFILDLFHALEYLWKAAHVFHAEGSPEAEEFVRHRLHQLLEGKVGYVIGGLRQMLTKHRNALRASQRKTLETVIGYYQRNRRWMRYDAYIAAGYPIGSGAVESACRHLVKDRMEGSGMRWTVAGAQAVLKTRAVHLNGDWTPFWEFHMKQERQRRFTVCHQTLLPSVARANAAG